MCAFAVDKDMFIRNFGHRFEDYFTVEARHIQECVEDGLIEDNKDRITVTEFGKLFIRNVCMGFDHYLRQKDGHKRFSRTV